MITILDQDPPSGTVPYKAVVYYDDGSEPLGTVTRVTGGSNSQDIPREEDLVIDPRLTENATSPHGAFGVEAKAYMAGIANSADPGNPIESAVQYTLGHQRQYIGAVEELAADPAIKQIAHGEATFSLSPAQLLGEVIKSGIGGGILSDASQVASNLGLNTGPGVVSVEAGAVALTLGAVAQAYDNATGHHIITQVEHQLAGAAAHLLQGTIARNS